MDKKTFRPVDVQVNGRYANDECIFIDTPVPEFSWRTDTNDPSFRQKACRLIAKDEQGRIIWDTGKTHCNSSKWFPWQGPKLKSRQQISLRIQVHGQNRNDSGYSKPINFEVGLLDNSDWKNASWIWFDRNNYTTTAPSPMFRKQFAVKKGLAKARLYITARGVFEASLDGQKIGRDELAPGWTDFKKQIPYMTYDLTDALKKPGQHTLGAVIADGWCCGNLTIFRYRNRYHAHPELLARLELTYEDGKTQAIVTDGSWKVTTGPIISADLYDGENYDARLEKPGWNTNGYDTEGWWDAAVGEKAKDSPLLVQKMAPPVRVMEEIKPVKILNPAKDMYIWDFGQNFTGKFRISNFRGVPGRLYTFKMAEMLNEHGELYNLNYRSARSEDSYICPGPFDKKLEYTPTFTFHGLRYLQIFGFQLDDLKPEDLEVTGLVMYSDMDIKSSFECGDGLVNRLWLNTQWGHRGNYLEIPTDCPQRDERMGWTGDAQVFSATAMYNMDCCAFLRKYLRDIRDAQKPEGASPSIAPAILDMAAGAGAWGDAIAIIPFNLYQHFGWKKILEENFEAMKKSVLWQKKRSENLIRSLDSQFGDWLASEPTDKYLVATAYFGRCARIVAETAKILGATKDAKDFSLLADNIAAAFCKKYTKRGGLVKHGTQCAYCLAIEYGLLPEKHVAVNVKALAEDIKAHGGKMTTGFLGTPIILDVLAKHGYQELACDLVLQQEYPSWLFSVLQGATTMWERWNSYTLKDGFGSVAMNSFNHYAYGVVAKFLLEELGGIHYDKDGLRLQIFPDKRFAPVKANYDSPYGLITSAWAWKGKKLTWEVTVPAGLPSCTAVLPDGTTMPLKTGKHKLL